MKLRIVLSIVFILSFACSAAELNVITFADANLEQAIQQELGIDTPVSEQQMLELTTLNAEEYSIQNLDGLRYAINLTELYLNNNEISNISELSDLKQLEILFLSNNNISDISAVKDLKELRILQLWNNDVNDISPAAELEYLEGLAFINNNVEDISVLANLKNLKMIDMEYNPLNEQAYAEIIPKIKLNNPGIKISYTPGEIDDMKETTLTPEIKYDIIKSRVIFPLVFMLIVCFTIMIFSEKIIQWRQKK